MTHFRTNRTGRVATALCAAVALTFGLAACGSSSDDSTAAAQSTDLSIGSTFTSAIAYDPTTPGAATSTFLDPVYDTLLHYEDGELKPWLATSWDFKDPTTLELKLREGVTFTDGTPFDAAAVQANLQHALDNGANQGDQVFLSNIDSMTVVDPTTIDLKLKQPNPGLPYNFSQYSGYMASPKALENSEALQQAPVGSGPYVVDDAASRPGVSIVYKRNPDYWAADTKTFPYDTVTITMQADPTALKNAAQSGQVKALSVDPGVTIPGFDTVLSKSGENSGFTGVWVDPTGTTVAATGDERVRQALNYAIDREKLASVVYKNTAVAIPGVPVLEGDPAYSDELGKAYPYDPAKAKQLLAEAGYPDGLEIAMISLPVTDQFAQAIAGQLQEVGIKVNIETHSSDLVQTVLSGTKPTGMTLNRLTGDIGQDLGQLIGPNLFWNVHKGDDPELTALLEQAASQTDPAEQTKLYQEAALKAADAAWYFATLQLQTTTAFDPTVVKVVPEDRGAIHLYSYDLPS